MPTSSTLLRVSRRLAVSLLAGGLLLACSGDDDDSSGGPSTTGNLFQFTVEGPSITARTATFAPTDGFSIISSIENLLFVIGAGSDVEAVSTEGETYGQVKLLLEKDTFRPGSYRLEKGQMQLAIYPTAADAQAKANDKVMRSAPEDGVPGGLDLIVTSSGDDHVEGTFSGTLNCTNCTPTETYTITNGAFRFRK